MDYDGASKYDAAVAASYDADREHEAHWSAENEFIQRLFTQGTVSRVLDIPVGTGRFIPLMNSACGIVGVDISSHMLAYARAATRSSPHKVKGLAQADVLQLPFKDGAFDRVVSFRLIHLLPPELLTSVLTELRRVCSGGTIFVQIYASPNLAVGRPSLRRRCRSVSRLFQRFGTVARRTPKKPWSHIQSFSHTEQTIIHAAREAGLVVEDRHLLGKYEGVSVVILELST